MSTAIDVIQRALYTIGAHSEINPASPEMLVESFDYLVDLLRDWTGNDIDIGATIPTSQTSDLGEDSGSRHALILSLAIRLAPMARVAIPPGVIEQQWIAFEDLRRKFETVTIADRTDSASVADGAGNMRGPI